MAGISIIIITYNRPADSLSLLQDIQRLQHRERLLQEVILLNNASTADYSEVTVWLNTAVDFPARLVDAPENLGVSRGRNYAAAMATGDFLFFLDDDTCLEDPELLLKIEQAFARPVAGNRPMGVMGCKVYYAENRQIQQTAFPHKDFEGHRDLPFFLTSYYVGCAHIFRRAAWLAAGPYPVGFFYGMEEYDESYRVLEAGYCIAYDASLEVFHKESPLGRKPRAEQLRHMWVNKSTVAWKYLPLPYFLTTTLAWSGFYLQQTGGQFKEFFRGWKEVLAIPRRHQKQPVGSGTMAYLRSVKARLWF